MSSKFEHLQEKTTRLESNASRVGLKINIKKSKCMKVNSNRVGALKGEQGEIEDVESFTYLGAEVSKDGGSTGDIRRRIGLAWGAFQRLRKVWYTRNIGRKTKITLFKTLIMSVLL